MELEEGMDYPISAQAPHGADASLAFDSDDLRLEGAPNFRDVCRVAVAGGRLRSGRVFRSDRLAHLTPADLAALGALDLRLVCDVRSPAERELHPNRLPEGHVAHLLHLDISADLRADTLLIDAIR